MHNMNRKIPAKNTRVGAPDLVSEVPELCSLKSTERSRYNNDVKDV